MFFASEVGDGQRTSTAASLNSDATTTAFFLPPLQRCNPDVTFYIERTIIACALK